MYYVYPSRLEGIGLTIAEALASGLPVIVPDNPPMNEFYDQSSSKLVKIKKIFSRSDGYYWPQCEVDIDDLAAQMNFYVKNIHELDQFKKSARAFAENHLNWVTNAASLAEKIEACSSNDLNRDILNKINVYESKERTLTTKLMIRYPLISKLLAHVFLKKIIF